MRRVRDIFVVLFLLIMIAQSMGVYPVFVSARRQIQSEVKARIKSGIPEDELLSFSFDKLRDEIVWMKPGKEFKWGQHLYDVIRWESVDGDSTLICFMDLRESGLFAGLNDLVKSQGYGNGQSPGKLQLVVKFFFGAYKPGEPLHIPPVVLPESTHYTPYRRHLHPVYQDVGAHPPEIHLSHTV